MKSSRADVPCGLVAKPVWFALATFWIVACAAPLWADKCQVLRDKVTDLQLQVDNKSKDLYLPCCKPGLPPKPVKDPEVQKQLDALKIQLTAAQHALNQCEAAPPTPPPTVKISNSEGHGVPDPQIAVGFKFFATLDTGNIGFFQKSDHQFAPPFTKVTTPGQMFGSFFKTIDESMHLPTWVCDPDHPDPTFFTSGPKKGHIKDNFGCIAQWYDTRAVYDAKRHRFWIATALRPFIWQCTTKDGQLGLETEGPSGRVWDPDPEDKSGKTPLCHTDWDQSWFRRFTAVAVSETDSSGEESLHKFHKYVLTEALGDWPEMAVNDDYLLLYHLDSKNRDEDPIEIFNAQDLADGVQDGTVLKVPKLLKIQFSEMVAHDGSKEFTPTGDINLVTNHGPSNGMNFIVAGVGDHLLVFAAKAPDGNPSGTPRFLGGTAIDMGHSVGHFRVNPIFRNGKLFIADFECINGKGVDCDHTTQFGCRLYIGRLYRVPVGLSADGKTVHVSKLASEGFLDYRVSDVPGLLSYVNTMVEVNKDEDMVYAFERLGLTRPELEPPSVRFSTFYHDQMRMSASSELQAEIGNEMPSDPDPGIACGIVDLGGIALDPSDDRTIWFSHAFSSHGSYTSVVGAVKP